MLRTKNKKGAIVNTTDMAIGIIGLIVISWIFITGVDFKRVDDKAKVAAEISKNDVSQLLMTFVRLPIDDNRMIAEHIVDAYHSGYLQEDTADNYITEWVYWYFNVHYSKVGMQHTWRLSITEVVDETLTIEMFGNLQFNPRREVVSYNAHWDQPNFNRYQDGYGVPSQCQGGEDLATLATISLPVQKENIKALEVSLKACDHVRMG